MPDYAIVIGVNKYAQPGMDLTYPVPQALRMAAWLLSPTGGNVSAAKLPSCSARSPPRTRPRGST
jgi:hypothetical protein